MVSREGNPLDIDAILRIIRISQPVVSEGGNLAYTVSRPDPEANKDRDEVWVHWAWGPVTFYAGEGDSSPAWSPSGRLAFLSRRGASKEEKGVGVFIAGYGGDPRLVAWFRHSVWGLEWLDDDSLLAGSREPRGWMYDSDGDYVATDRLPLWFNGRGLVAGAVNQVYLVDSYSGRVNRLTGEDDNVSLFKPCGDTVYYTVPVDWRRPHVHVLKAVRPGGEAWELARGYSVQAMECIGGRLHLLAHRLEIGLASHSKLHVLEGDGVVECLTCGVLDRNIWSLSRGPGGDPLLVYVDGGRGVIARYSGGVVEDVTRGDFIAYSVGYGGDRIYALVTTPTSPPDIYRVSMDGGLERVTRFNAWVEEEYELSRPRRLVVEARGDAVEGWVLEPPPGAPVYGERRPLLLFIHGGPKGMYGYGFHGEHQYYAAQGFIVAYANPRGSDGYSEEFADIRGRYGDVDYDQLMAFLDRVLEEYLVDRDRMAVTGISYGGYMANVVITRTDRFRAAVPENGIADWIADFWAADIGYWFDPDQIGGTPWDNLEGYVEKSPAFHAGEVTASVLTIHSLEDYRCFIDQALAMHVALSMQGKDSTLLVFTKGDHGHSVRAAPRHRRKRLEIKTRWLKEKLGLEGRE